MRPTVSAIQIKDSCRLVPSRYPSEGILDVVSGADDLVLMIELDSWTNDRISAEVGILHRLPREEWVVGRPMSSVIMAPFCHPRVGGGRFNPPERGAWYAGFSLETAHEEVIYHRTRELLEVGVLEARVQMRLYLADFAGSFHDIRTPGKQYATLHDPLSYHASQDFSRTLLDEGSNGILYRSVRQEGGFCIACFRPKLVRNVRARHHFEYRWEGTTEPSVRRC